MEIRWIVNIIKQAEMEKSGSRRNEEKYVHLMEKAQERIDELNQLSVYFDMEKEKNIIPAFSNWEGIFRDVLLSPPDKKPVNNRHQNPEYVQVHDGNDDNASGLFTDKSGTSSTIIKDNNEQSKTSLSRLPLNDSKENINENAPWNTSKERHNAYYDYQIGDYKFRFNPQKGELSIRLETEDEDLVVKIKGGKFPEDNDFCVRDGRLIKSETGEETPFLYERNKDGIRITDTESGEVVDFNLN